MKRERKYTRLMAIRLTEAEHRELVEKSYQLRKPMSVYAREIVLRTDRPA